MIKCLKLIVLVTICFVNCSSPHDQPREEDQHFEVNFDLTQASNKKATLSFEIALDSGYYFVSPHSEGFHQRLLFSIENTDKLLLQGELMEIPETHEEYDDLSEKQGRFVRENTTYRQSMIIGTQNDFVVSGLIWLVVAPTYQPYEISFILSSRSGHLRIEDISTSISGFPTFWDKKRLDTPRSILDKTILNPL